MKYLITENQKSELLINLVKNGEVDMASDLVGGMNNLINIVGKSKLMDVMISKFDKLNITKRGGSILLMNGGLPILEKPSSIWGLDLTVYDDYIKLTIGDELTTFYTSNRRNLIKELVSRFPELYSEKVRVYKDTGKYLKIAEYEL